MAKKGDKGHSGNKGKGRNMMRGGGHIPKMHPGKQPRGPRHLSHKNMPMKG